MPRDQREQQAACVLLGRDGPTRALPALVWLAGVLSAFLRLEEVAADAAQNQFSLLKAESERPRAAGKQGQMLILCQAWPKPVHLGVVLTSCWLAGPLPIWSNRAYWGGGEALWKGEISRETTPGAWQKQQRVFPRTSLSHRQKVVLFLSFKGAMEAPGCSVRKAQEPTVHKDLTTGWLMGMPLLQPNECECNDYLTKRRVDLWEMILPSCQKEWATNQSELLMLLSQIYQKGCFSFQLFFFFSFLKEQLSVHPFPGTDIEANVYQILLHVTCLSVTSCWVRAAKLTWYLSAINVTVATVVGSCSGLSFAHPEGTVIKTGPCC